MTPDELRDRIRTFAVEVAKATRPFVSDPALRNAALQGSRSAAAFAANYRAACLAKSRRDFIAKLATVVEEADETVYWLELLRDTSPTVALQVAPAVLDESHQLVRIVSASLATARRKRQ